MRLWASVIVQATCAGALAYGTENMHTDSLWCRGRCYTVGFGQCCHSDSIVLNQLLKETEMKTLHELEQESTDGFRNPVRD